MQMQALHVLFTLYKGPGQLSWKGWVGSTGAKGEGGCDMSPFKVFFPSLDAARLCELQTRVVKLTRWQQVIQ